MVAAANMFFVKCILHTDSTVAVVPCPACGIRFHNGRGCVRLPIYAAFYSAAVFFSGLVRDLSIPTHQLLSSSTPLVSGFCQLCCTSHYAR